MKSVVLGLIVIVMSASAASASCVHCPDPQGVEVKGGIHHNVLVGGVSVPQDISNNSSSSAVAHGGQASAVGGAASVQSGDVVNSVDFEAAASTAYAASLVASSGTCMGSGSAGGQGVGFGLSLARTWTDDDCNRRRNAAALDAMGEREAAIQLLCLNDEVKSVLARCRP